MKTCNLRRAAWFASALALSMVLVSPALHAQAEDQAAARTLFEQGRRLLKEKQYPEACQKLEAASRLYSSPGIHLNLADCYEKLGRTASAWTEFGEAAAAANRSHRADQAAEANRRQSALEAKLARIAIHVSKEVVGLSVKRDGADLAPAAWGTAIPVDPGTHQVRAEAPGYELWTTSVDVPTSGQTVSVDVPELSPTPKATPAIHSPEAEPLPQRGGGQREAATNTSQAPRGRTLDWVLIGGGALVAVAGGVLWAIGLDRANAAGREPTNTRTNLAAANGDYNSALTLYWVGVGGVIAGGAAAAAGALLFVMLPDDSRSPSAARSVRASPWASSGGAGAQLQGAW